MPGTNGNASPGLSKADIRALLQASDGRDGSQWLFTEEELLRTPSILDGLPAEKEREHRGKGVNFILQVGIMLKLPQITLATASVFLHRFYVRHSMQDMPGRPGFHHYSVAATSLFLATKVEENCRKMKELVIACVRVAQKDPYKIIDEQDKEYWRWRDNILLNEDLLLEAMCFDLRLEPPYKLLYDLLLLFDQENNKRLRNSAWAFISDSCLTTLCLLYPSRTIATSALYAAARHCGCTFPDSPDGSPWWESVGESFQNINRACDFMAEIYSPVLAKPGRETGMYKKIPPGSIGTDDATRVIAGVATSDIQDVETAVEGKAEDKVPILSVIGGEKRSHSSPSNGLSKRPKLDAEMALDKQATTMENGTANTVAIEAKSGEVKQDLTRNTNGDVANARVSPSQKGAADNKGDNASEEGEVEP